MKINTCGKYFCDYRISQEDLEWLGIGSCATCVHCNSITGCEVTPRGKDTGDGKTYISDSGKIYGDDLN